MTKDKQAQRAVQSVGTTGEAARAATEPSEVAGDGGVREREVSSDLSERGTGHREPRNVCELIATPQPIGRAERLRGEGNTAVGASKALDIHPITDPSEDPGSLF